MNGELAKESEQFNTGCRNGGCMCALGAKVGKGTIVFRMPPSYTRFGVCMCVPTSCPDVQLFRRFQNQWQFIDQDNFDHGLLDMRFNETIQLQIFFTFAKIN